MHLDILSEQEALALLARLGGADRVTHGQFGQRPPKSRTGLIVAVVVIAVLVLGGIGVGIYVLTRGDDEGTSASGTGTSGSPKPDPTSAESKPTAKAGKPTGGNRGGTEADLVKTAKDYVAAVNTGDKAGATEFTCDKTGPGSLYNVSAGKGDVVAGKATVMNGVHGGHHPQGQLGGCRPAALRIQGWRVVRRGLTHWDWKSIRRSPSIRL